MKPWSERSAGERTGIVIGAAAALVAALFGVQRLSAPSGVAEAPAPSEASQTAGAADTAATAPEPATPDASAEATDEAAAPVAEGETAATTEDAAPETADADPAAESEAEAGTDAAAGAEPAAEEPAGTAEAEAPAAAPEAAPAAPELDLVRVSRDGSAVIAGNAAAGSSVRLMLDGVEIGAVPADAQGNFVALFNLAPSAAPRVLTLSALLADGTEVQAEGRIAIAPTVAPAALSAGTADAAADPAPEEAPAALFVTDEGARVLQTADDLSPALAANVTVDAITYSPEGAVQLAGRGTGGAVVRLYLDNAQVADTAVDGQGSWAVTLGDVAPGLYTLRADQIDAAGKVTSRFETPFQRETLEALAAAAAQTGGAEATDATAADAPAAEGAATEGTATEGTAAAGSAAEGAADDAAATAGTATAATESAATDGTADATADAAGADAATADAGADAGADAATGPISITVQPGFTLWRIARENLGDGILYVQVFEANKAQIRDPDLIYPGQVFTIPAGQ